MAEIEGYKRLLGDKPGNEVMVWTSGGHYFRGTMVGIDAAGFLVLEEVSCTLAGERHERDRILVSLDALDGISPD